WKSAIDTLDRNPSRSVIVDASRLEYADNVGIALLFDLLRRDRPADARVEIRALAPNLAALVRSYKPADFAAPPRGGHSAGIVEHVGRATAQQIAYLKTLAGFLVACANALRQALTQRGVVSSREVFDVATEAGANAVPIVVLVGFLMGVIMAFEIGLVARQFGAAVFVVDGVGVAVVGCQRGLATGAGATAVGLAATSTVVTSIVLVVVIDGIFAVLTS